MKAAASNGSWTGVSLATSRGIATKTNPSYGNAATVAGFSIWRCVDCPGDLALRGERQDLEEMASNLIDNACKWAHARIAVAARRGTASVFELSVGDDGEGIDPGERILVGERGDENVPGSGLGLAIARDIAKLYGGTLTLSDSTLGGLEARLKLPAIT